MKKLLFFLPILSANLFVEAMQKKKTASQIEAKMRKKAQLEAKQWKASHQRWDTGETSWKQPWGWGQQPRKLILSNWALEQGWAYNENDVLTYKGKTLAYYEKYEPQLYETAIKELKRIEDEDTILRTGGQAIHFWQTLYPRHEQEAPEKNIEKG